MCDPHSHSGILRVGCLTWPPRVLMAHAQRLTEQVKSMSEKIKQLEQALEGAQSSSEHSLLGTSARFVPDDPPDIHTLFDDEGQVREATEAMGSLSIGQYGQVKYHGESASSEVIILIPPHSINQHFQMIALSAVAGG